MLEEITEILRLNQPLKAREIAKHLGEDRSAISAFLHRHTDVFVQDGEYQWSLIQPSELVIEFPETSWLTTEQFETALCSVVSPLESAQSSIIFEFAPKTSLLLDAMARLLALCNQLVEVGKSVTLDFSNCKPTSSYLNRIGFFDHLAGKVSVLPTRPKTSLASAHKGGNAGVVELAPINMDLRDDEIPRRLQRSFEQCAGSTYTVRVLTILGELFDNVHEHSESPIPGFAALQLYKKGSRPHIRTVFSDSGIGIVGSLQPTLSPTMRRVLGQSGKNLGVALIEYIFSHGQLSRVQEDGRGLGLKRAGDFANKFNASITVRQEMFEVTIHYRAGVLDFQHRLNLQKMRGTHICFNFDLTG